MPPSFPPMPTSAQSIEIMASEPAMLVDDAVAKNMSNTLEQILDVLRGSTIAEERGGDIESKFWATYKKISDEYDDDFLERANDDMAIILIFAGLFSTVNTTFIISMQPNPADTTNTLMVQMISIMIDGSNAVNTSNLSPSTRYVSSIIWMQTLLYASLAFSLLAAFGAVLGKQWLNSYKAARGRGTLEERGKQRQKKFDGIEYWQLQTILKAFLVLLQISLFLFALSLSANMWIRQTAISIVIMSTTAFGMLFYLTTIFVSVFYPDSPFQTAESALIIALCKKFFTLFRKLFDTHSNTPSYILPMLVHKLFNTLLKTALITRLTDDSYIKSSAIRWLLETSTNPDVVEPAAGMVPLAQWPRDQDVSTIYARLRDAVTTYCDRQELFVKCGKAMAHLCLQPVIIDKPLLRLEMRDWEGKGHFIRDAFITGHDAWKKLKMTKAEEEEDRQKLNADIRTAVGTMAVYGSRDGLLRPDDVPTERCDLQWRRHDGRTPSSDEFDWLIDYLVDKLDNTTDDETQGDALLVLSAMNGLGSGAKRASYIRALIRCMAPIKPPRIQCAAVKAISDAREELSSIMDESMPRGVDAKLLDELFSCLLTVVSSSDDSTDDPALKFYYSRLIFSLTKRDEWRQRLIQNGHVQQCIHLFPDFLKSNLYIAGICSQIDPTGNDPSLSSIQGRWEELLMAAWHGSLHSIAFHKDLDDCLEILPALVTLTKQRLSDSGDGIASSELECLDICVDGVLQELQKRDDLDGGVLSAMQSLSDDLKCTLSPTTS